VVTGTYLDDLAQDSARARPTPRYCGGDEAAALILSHVVFGQLADGAAFNGMSRLVVLHIQERMPVSRGSPASQAPSPTLDEIGKVYGVTRERIRQIESKTMSKLRHPSRSQVLRDYLD